MREGLHKIVSSDETIVAISTPLGRSAIGVVRLSGSKCMDIVSRFFKPAVASGGDLEHRVATLGIWNDPDGERIDEVVVTVFRAPHSYTGEDIVEISGHGNPFVLVRIVETVRHAAARHAAPGEFTLRAVANGKMDLIQAEALNEFIEAQTAQQAKTARRQMEGSISKKIRPVKERLIDVAAHLEAGIDFAEDDVDVPDNASIAAKIREAAGSLSALQSTFGYGRILAEGLRLAILGKPNVGKSSLFNRLVAADRAIVTEIPGTTRDVLTETVNLDGVPLRFTDTAGVRQTTDRVESLGVMRAYETLADADLALVILDGSNLLDADDHQVLEKTKGIPHIIVVNKQDLPQAIDVAALNGSRRVHVSALTGLGLDGLQASIRSFLLDRKTDLADDLVLTSSRQHEAVGRAMGSLQAAAKALDENVPHEMVLLDLYQALGALDEMTGEVVTEDILDRIFSTFCIGK